MGRLLPSSTRAPDREPEVIGLAGEEADDLVGALSAGTARELLSELYEEPGAPSELADRVDTTLQNAQYHLEKLESADLIEEVDTVYSEKGREMRVFAPASEPLVVVAGGEEETSTLRTAIGRLLGAVAVLAAASLAVQEFVGESVLPSLAGAGGGGDGGGEAVGTAEVTAQGAETAGAAGAGLPPGLLFFLGGLVALVVAAGLWYWRS
ncbi:MAG: ArsR/SmtB family transcription factor [Halobacteriaceae archaeon]